MSEEMAVSDSATEEEAPTQNEESTADCAVDETVQEAPEQPPVAPAEPPQEQPLQNEEESLKIKEEPQPDLTEEKQLDPDIKNEPEEAESELSIKVEVIAEECNDVKTEVLDSVDVKRGIKRRASEALSDDGDVEFLGFVDIKQEEVIDEYSQVLERLEAEVSAASKTFTPVRFVMATPPAPIRALKRPRKDTGTDGSRPSSAQSSRSEDDPSASPAHRGRRTTSEMSSPLLRVPLERGWKRELVYRATLDMQSRRNADIYYYSPQGKKLRSTREIADQLSGTGLSLDNFSFFKEPLGVDDPEKEIIRDAKITRRESPITSPAPVVDGKRPHKPKAPKGASPEPAKTTPNKIKVKLTGSRLSTPSKAVKVEKPEKPKKAAESPAPAPAQPDNNNSAAWKKPRALPAGPGHEASPGPAGQPSGPPAQPTWPMQPSAAATLPSGAPFYPNVMPAQPTGAPFYPNITPVQATSTPFYPNMTPVLPDVASFQPISAPIQLNVAPIQPTVASMQPIQEPRPALIGTRSRSTHLSRETLSREATPVTAGSRDVTSASRDVIAPPSVPRLATPPPQPQPRLQELSSPDAQSPRRVLQPCSLLCGAGVPSLSCAVCLCMYHPKCAGVTHMTARDRFLCKNCRKSSSPPPVPTQTKPPAAPAAPRRVPAPPKPNEKRVTLRMKVSGGSDGNKVWAVAAPRASAPRRSALPQSLAVINGKRDGKLRGRVANGTASPALALTPAAPSPRRRGRPRNDDTDHFTAFYNRAQQGKSNIAVQIFQYLGMRDLAHCARVCKLWKQLADTPELWRHVRMKNSQVNHWGGLCAALKRHGTKWLDLRKMLLPQNDAVFWEQFAQHIGSVDTLERLEMCRCPARAVEAAAGALPNLRVLTALAIRDAALDPAPLASAKQLRELRLKSMAGLALTADLTHLQKLTHLHHLSLTSIKELGWRACDVIGSLPNLESLELGECTFRAEFAGVLARLTRLTRLRLERGTAACAAPAILRALARLPRLQRLELVNVDVKVGFDDALAECTNIQRLLIIPTYVSQSATTNKQVLSGVLRLKETLTHLMWGVTIELLRVTELFIDQCSASGGPRRDLGECIPVLKPVPGCRLPMEHQLVAGPPQVEILPLPTLQRLLSAQLPKTKLKLLRIPFHATWRQSLADFQ